MPSTVVIACPQARQRAALRDCLSRDRRLRVAAATGHRQVAAELLQALEPDAAVIDCALLGCDFPLEGWGPVARDVALVAVGHGTDPHLVARLRRAGFAAYVCTTRLDEELADAVADASGAR